ncbi:MAG: HAD family hydrolase [Solidesulfovibrio sp. DCME]|uniref:HAD family hydrolase n=1 Tax=Solidesulfovibrio sp. DCME TaxID=3447380 RepID=UPI003D0B579C
MALYAIPGQDPIEARHLVLDYNGTLAADGLLVAGVADRLRELALPPHGLAIHVVTADTMGTVRRQLDGLPCVVSVLGPAAQDVAKREYVQGLGASSAIAVGNGQNDRLMLAAAALGIAIVGAEGAAVQAVLASRVVCRDIASALDLLRYPKRLAATLRL